jgi:hypothetical protein
MRKSTNKLTKHELDFASETEYPLTKQKIMHKIGLIMETAGLQIAGELTGNPLFEGAHHKITRGERYKDMPYMVLDFPQIKGPAFPIVLRTMFWWGHYFSCSLILRTALVDPGIAAKAIPAMSKTKMMMSDQGLWEQELGTELYRSTADLDEREIRETLTTLTYLKLSRRISLEKHEVLNEKATRIYMRWLRELEIKKELV